MRLVAATVLALAFALPAAAARAPTIEANPSTVGMLSQVALSGTTGSGKPGQTVYVEAKECNASYYRVVTAATASVGGSWTAAAPVQRTTTYRARAGNAYSRAVVVRKRAVVSLSKMPNSRVFLVRVHGGYLLAGRKIRLERYTTSGWVLVRQAKLRRSDIFGEAETTFRILKKGLRLRAFVPPLVAKPCFVAGASTIVRS